MICAATGPSSCLPFGVAGSAIHDLDFSHSLERLRNDPMPDGFSRAWVLRNGIAVLDQLAIPLCSADGFRTRFYK